MAYLTKTVWPSMTVSPLHSKLDVWRGRGEEKGGKSPVSFRHPYNLSTVSDKVVSTKSRVNDFWYQYIYKPQ